MNVASHPLQAPPVAGRLRAAHVSVAGPASCWNPMPTHEQLNDWMKSVATASDRTAFAALFKHFAPRIKSYLMRSGSTPEVAEELAQEAMVLLWRRASTFDPARANASTWLFTIARNVRIDHYRRRSTDLDGSGGGQDIWEIEQAPVDPALDPEEAAGAMQRARGVQRALAELPADQARVLRLSFFDEHPHARIAQELGIPLGTVKSRIRLAVSQLRRKLDGLAP
jgi:RNA polymerase sigma factor (sigma-70 family)